MAPSSLSQSIWKLGSALVVAMLINLPAAGPAWALGEACPDYHREDKVLGARVKADLKRYARSQGVPERLMYLYDQLADCPACLGGDALHPILPYMYIVYSGDPPVRAPGFGPLKHRGTSWSADEEWAARQGMRDGSVKAYYILLETSECECCTATTEEEWEAWNAEGDPDPTESPDYDEELDIDTSLSYSEEDPDNLGPDPKDLTEIDDKDRYPDELPVPPLNIRPPIRPMTTGCDACQPLVNEHNDLVIRINAQHRELAVAERRLGIALAAIRFKLREIRGHQRKAQNAEWEATQNRLWREYGGLVATSFVDQAAIEQELRKLAELLDQRERLRDAILDCESRCKLLDTQPEPVIGPEQPIDEADPTLPPYVRIASQACPSCQEALDRRNDIARDMNELVTGLIDTGLNANSIDAWNALRSRLNVADEALSDCFKRCNTPELGGAMMAGALDANADCASCERFRLRVEFWRAEWKSNQAARSELQDRIRSLSYQLEKSSDPDEGSQHELRRLERDLEKLERRRDSIKQSWRLAELALEHCLRTRCPGTIDKQPDLSWITDEEALESDDIGFFYWGLEAIRNRGFFFVDTTCSNCQSRALEINQWVWSAHQTVLDVESLKAMSPYNPDGDARRSARLRAMEFLFELRDRVAELRECERRECPDTHSDPEPSVYAEPNIASPACLDSNGVKEKARSSASNDALPDTCADSWLARWIFGCGERCQENTDIAAEKGAPATATLTKGNADIAGQWNNFWASTRQAPDQSALWKDKVWEWGKSRELLVPSSASPNDPYFRSSSSVVDGLADQWGAALIDSPAAIESHPDAFVTGQRTIVAVIDTGIDQDHPDLDGALWTNIAELPDNSIDEDGNGFVDDVFGWNFVQDNGNVSDRNGHGTLVAGIVAARWNNGLGIAGVNPWAKIMPLKVMNFRGDGNSVDIAAAITYAVNEGASVINVSLGGDEFSEAERVAVNYAQRKNVLVVVAAGNTGIDASDYWPAGLDNVITVAATEPGDKRARYSNWGSPIDIAAPGTDILSLRARHTDLMWFVEDDYPMGRNIVGDEKLLYHATGTSFAAPFVSGVASLLFSLKPGLSAAEVRRMILHSARDIETPGVDALTGYGRLDAAAALAADPAFFVDAAIVGVGAVRTDAGLVVQVRGTADADEFDSAVVQFGEGENPDGWETLNTRVTAPVRNDVLGEIPAAPLRSAPKWALRVVTTHASGATREARYELQLE